MSNIFVFVFAFFVFAVSAQDDLVLKATLAAKKNSINPSATVNFIRKQELEGKVYFDFEFKTASYRMGNGVCIYEHEYITVELIEGDFHPQSYEHHFEYGIGADCNSVQYYSIKGGVFVLDVFEIKGIIDSMFVHNDRSLLSDNNGFSKEFVDEIFNADLVLIGVEEISYGVLKFKYLVKNNKDLDMVSLLVENEHRKIKNIKIEAGAF